MRLFGLSLALLAACSIDNPYFGLTNDPSQGGSDGTGASTTTAPPPTSSDPTSGPDDTSHGTSNSGSTPTTAIGETTEDVDTTTPSQTTAIGETTVAETTNLAMPGTLDSTDPSGTTTLDPDSGDTSTNPDPSEDTLDPEPFCPIDQPFLPSDQVIDILGMKPYEGCQNAVQVFPGHGRIFNGALYWAGGPCQNPVGPYKLEFGTGYLGTENVQFCGEITVYWAPGCTIGALWVKDFVQGKDVFGVYHSPTKIEDPSFPYEASIDPPGTCDCPNMVPGCCNPDPGEHNLIVSGVKVPKNQPTPVLGNTWYNYQVFMSESCINDLNVEPEVHWSVMHGDP